MAAPPLTAEPTRTAADDVLKALSRIIDPDFGTDIVSCGFVKDLKVDEGTGKVAYTVLLSGSLPTFVCLVRHILNCVYNRCPFAWS